MQSVNTCVRPWLLIGLCSLHSLAWGQLTSGSLTGVVSDPSAAVIPGAKVVLTDTDKAYDYPGTTDGTGRYLITNLPPSTYEIRVEARGFKAHTQSGIILNVGTRLSVDIRLEVEATAQTAEVTGASPLLATQDAVTGQEIDRSMIGALPLYGRSLLDLAYLAPGVIQNAGLSYGPSHGSNDFVSNGGRTMTAELLIDGITASSYEPNTGIYTNLYVPSVDAVQEFKLVQNNYTAEEGFSGNTYVNMVMRSGTNSYHGTLYEFLRNDKLNANNFFSNRQGGKVPPVRQNQYGLTFGGPVRKDKTFFFVDWEGVRAHSGVTRSAGVPSAAMRNGDFREICPEGFDSAGMCVNPNHQLWDPYSGIYTPAQGGRVAQTFIPFNNLATFRSAGNPGLDGTPFQLAPVPGNLIDPVAAKIMPYFPLPNLGVGTPSYNRFTNWTGSGVNVSAADKFDVRIDQRFSDKTSFMVRYSHALNSSDAWNAFGNALDVVSNGPATGGSRSVALMFNETFNPTTLFSLSLGFSRNYVNDQGVAADFPSFDPIKDLGLPAYMLTSGVPTSPAITINNYTVVGNNSIGAQTFGIYVNGIQVYQLLPIFTKMKGHHELKFGAEWRENQMNWYQVGRPMGQFSYSQFGTTSQFPGSGGGDSMATFLTGVGGSGSYQISPHFSTTSYRWGGFVQDNWRATEKLTLNIGLRYDLEIPRTERYNRMSWLDTTVALPIHPAPIDPTTWPSALPYMPDVTHPVGGIQFASNSQRQYAETNYKDWGPRFGLAYRIRNNLVLRGGYGLFYNPTVNGTFGGGQLGNEGFNASTNTLTTRNGDGVTPWGRLSSPWPDGLLLPTGASLGALTNVGIGIQEHLRTNSLAPPYTQTWSAGFQYQLLGGWVVTANYVGTKGTHLYYRSGGNYDVLGSWVEQEATNPALVTALNTKVPNPYYNVINTPGCGMCGPTITASQLLKPYPQDSYYYDVAPPWANSIYNAFQLTVEKVMAHGLAVLVSYTNSKSLDDSSASTYAVDGLFSSVRNPNNYRGERSLSEWDIPQVFQASYVWNLPFGKGQKWGGGWNPIVNGILGGWQTNGIWRFDNGQPISISLNGGLCPATYSCGYPEQTGSVHVNPKSLWLTQGYFANANSVLSVPANYVVGNAPREQPNVRKPGTNNASLSLFKQFSLSKLREGSRLEFRAEAFNALNHVVFGGPASTFNAGGFGNVTSQANSPREIQLALRLYF